MYGQPGVGQGAAAGGGSGSGNAGAPPQQMQYCPPMQAQGVHPPNSMHQVCDSVTVFF